MSPTVLIGAIDPQKMPVAVIAALLLWLAALYLIWPLRMRFYWGRIWEMATPHPKDPKGSLQKAGNRALGLLCLLAGLYLVGVLLFEH